MKRGISILLTICMILALIPDKAAASETAALSEPNVTALTVSYDGGETQDLLENQSTISLPAGSKPVFTVTFDNSEPLNRVFVTSTKNGETKYLEAKPQGGQYVTDDYFDPNDVNYIPGTISVTYSKKTVKVTERTQIGEINLTEMKRELEAQGASVSGEITTGMDGSINAQVVLDDYFSGVGETFIDASIKELTTSAGIDSDEVRQWIDVYDTLSSYALKSEDGKDYMLYFTDKDWTNANSYVMLVHDISGNRYIQMALKGNKLKEIAGQMSQANKFAGAYLDYVAISEEMDSLREDIAADPVMTPSQKTEANEKISALENDKKLFMMGVTFVPLFLGAAGVAAPLMLTALLAGYSSVADYFWDYRIGMIKGCEPIDGTFSENNDHGAGWTPLRRSDFEGSYYITITQSGNYFLTEEFSNIRIGNEASGPINVTLCLHGNHSSFGIYNDSTLQIYDCEYKEYSDGTVTGGTSGTIVLFTERCKLDFRSGILNASQYGIRNHGGEVIINGGVISGQVENTSGGKTTINGGKVGNITFESGGEIKVTGGSVGSIGIDEGTVTITDGEIGPINNGVAETIISGGSITNRITNKGGSITINGGQITNTVYNTSGTVTISGGMIAHYSWGIHNFSEGIIHITGGTIAGTNSQGHGIYNEGGIINISGGMISGSGTRAGVYNKDGGTVNVSGGNIRGSSAIENQYNGKIYVNGGIVQGKVIGVENHADSEVIISKGTIRGAIGVDNYSTGVITLLINEDSLIEVDSTSNAFRARNAAGEFPTKVPIIKVGTGYNSDITYYESASSPGSKKTIQETMDIDYTQPYICLVADGAAGGPSSGDTPDCTHTYTSIISVPTCTSTGYTTHICTKCGDSYQNNYMDALGHSYGAWNTIQSATPTATGLQERVCSRCGDRETRVIPATGESGGSAEGSGSHSSDRDSDPGPSYPVNEPKTENGSLSISPQNAVSGAIVTVTVKPDAGYELDTLTVTNKGGRQVRVTSKGNGQYTFRMPGSEAEIRATFKPIVSSAPAAAGTFSDVPTDHWAGTEISWALENGVMNGVGDGKFNPNGTVTRQQLWMTLARMAGEAPADMAAAKIWAVNNSISDGSVPGNTITRQQMAVILHRFAKLTGHSVSGSGDLSRYSDSGEISSYAREAMAWAVGSKILNGTADGALNPNGTATRAQIAVILHRFYSRVIHA